MNKILCYSKKQICSSIIIFLFLVTSLIVHAETESSNRTTALPNYYSESNLIRINNINEKIAKLNKDDAINPKQPLRQKHAPLLILSDPLDAEEHSNALQLMLYDLLYAEFKPLILFTASIFKRLLQKRNENFIDIEKK